MVFLLHNPFWAVALMGTKSFRTQGEFARLSVRPSVPPSVHPSVSPLQALSGLKSALSGLKSASKARNLPPQALSLRGQI